MEYKPGMLARVCAHNGVGGLLTDDPEDFIRIPRNSLLMVVGIEASKNKCNFRYSLLWKEQIIKTFWICLEPHFFFRKYITPIENEQ